MDPCMPADQNELLKALRIDREDREEVQSSHRGLVIGIVIALLLLAGAAVAFFMLRGERFEVETATAIAPSSGGGSNAVLQATGYVTARRTATVSAQITGTLTEVLIEEGERVEKGQVLARLENKAQ